MAHSLSARKRLRQSRRRRERNRARRSAARGAVRTVRELIAAGNVEEAEGAARAAASLLDRAARRGAIHANNAARRKSRLMRRLNRVQAGAAEEAAPKPRTRATSRARPARAKKSEPPPT